MSMVHYHLPGLFEFYDFYKEFLPLFYGHREYFYDWVDIGSIYGAPSDAVWGGGRFGAGSIKDSEKILRLLSQYKISARLTLSNSLLREEHLGDIKCNRLCEVFESASDIENGVVIHSDLLLDYLRKKYPKLYFVSSTTKVLTDFDDFLTELRREEFLYIVPDFRLNKQFNKLESLTTSEKNKVEFLCNECCYIGCTDRKACYENVSRKILDEDCPDHICKAPMSEGGYKFSQTMRNPSFISVEDIKSTYLTMGFTNFKIEGRNLGTALILEMLLYYMVKPEYQLQVREDIYLDSMLNLF